MKTVFTKNVFALLLPALSLTIGGSGIPLPATAQTPTSVGTIPVGTVALRDQSSLSLRKVAETGLRRMMATISRGQAADAKPPQNFPIAVERYGDLGKVSLGIGFEVNTIDPAVLAKAGRTADLGAMTRSADIWNFIILFNGRPVGLLELDKVQGRWQAVGAGSAKLAAEIVAVAPKTGDGSFRFVRIYQATSDLIEVRGNGQGSRYVPMRSAQRSLPIAGLSAKTADAAVAMSGEDLLPALQSAVRNNLQRRSR